MESHYRETNAIDELYGDDPAAHCAVCNEELYTGDSAYTLESGDIVCSRTCALNSTLENDSPMCPVCEGMGGLMGILGNLAHFRCIDCGMGFSYNLDMSKVNKIKVG